MFNTLKHHIQDAITWFEGAPAHGDDLLSRVEPTLTTPSNPPLTEQEILEVPLLVPESPLIAFMSQLTLAQRLGIRNITLGKQLGYHGEHTFQDAEALYQWLTPGKRAITNKAWPAENQRIKWFRSEITVDQIEQAAEVIHDADSLRDIVGTALF